ncbi:MAG: F0F1 ATP synthase subunit gamma [Patescibacteria group bacterium]
MSGSLLEIRKKIAGVKNTRKITKAMQLVAASKMRQFQKRALSVRHYVWDLFAILEDNLETKDVDEQLEAAISGLK